jgi:hypothetical protein
MVENTNIKSPNIIQEFTEFQKEEILKSKHDPLYFIQNYVKINTRQGLKLFDMHDYQKEIIDNVHKYDSSICMASRQLGKCLFFNGLVDVLKVKYEERTILGFLKRFLLKIFFRSVYNKFFIQGNKNVN